MKKSLIALAVLAASGAAMAQSSVTLFGIADVGVGYVKNSGGDSNYGLTNGGLNTSRLGFRGVEDLGGGLKAGFWLEGGMTLDDGTASGFNFKRRSTISVMGNFGEVRLGRDLTAGYKTVLNYDLFGQVGMGAFLGTSNNLYGTTGDADGQRASNLIAYYTPKIAGFNGGLQYGFGESSVDNKINRYLGAYIGFDNGPLSVTLAGDRNNFAAAPVLGSIDRTQVALGASFDFGMAKISGLIQRVEFEPLGGGFKDKVDNWALGASAPVGPGTLKLQYASYDDKNSSNEAQQLSLGYQYDLSKRTAVYTTVAHLKNKNGSAVALGGSGLAMPAVAGKNQTGFQVGVRHAF